MSEERRLVQSVEITDSGIHILQLKSVLDASTVPEFEEVLSYLLSQNHFHFIVDLSKVDFVSSAGWGVFVGELKKIREGGGDIKLAGMQPEVLDVFMLLELDQLIEAFSTVEEAIAAFLKSMPELRQAAPGQLPEGNGAETSAMPEPAESPEIVTDRAVSAPDSASADTPATDSHSAVAETEAQAPEERSAMQPTGQIEEAVETAPEEAEPEKTVPVAPNQTELDIEEAKRAAEGEAPMEEAADWATRAALEPDPVSEPENGAVPEDVSGAASTPELNEEAPVSPEDDTQEVLASDLEPAAEETAGHEILSDLEEPAASPEPQPEPDRLENPFDIAEIDDPWLGGMEMDYDENVLRSRLSDAMIEEVDLNVPDFEREFGVSESGPATAVNDGETAPNREATEEDYENLQWLKRDAVSLFEAAENGNSHHNSRLPDRPQRNARSRIQDDPLLEKIVSVVIANPSYGPSTIRKVLLEMNLIDASVTRSMIFKKLIQLGLTTRAKREAFAKNHSLE